METSIEMMYELIGKIWETDEIPIGWKEGYIVKIPKKGDLQECKNYRGIMLLSVPGKVLNIIILEILKNEVDNTLRDHQAGFRQDICSIDQIATLRIIVEHSMEFDSSLYINVVDYEKTVDSLDRDTLWKLRYTRENYNTDTHHIMMGRHVRLLMRADLLSRFK